MRRSPLYWNFWFVRLAITNKNHQSRHCPNGLEPLPPRTSSQLCVHFDYKTIVPQDFSIWPRPLPIFYSPEFQVYLLL